MKKCHLYHQTKRFKRKGKHFWVIASTYSLPATGSEETNKNKRQRERESKARQRYTLLGTPGEWEWKRWKRRVTTKGVERREMWGGGSREEQVRSGRRVAGVRGLGEKKRAGMAFLPSPYPFAKLSLLKYIILSYMALTNKMHISFQHINNNYINVSFKF